MDFEPVSVLSILAMLLVFIVSVGLPFALLVLIRKKTGARIAPFFWGCLSFFVFAMVLEQLLHRVVLAVSGSVLTENVLLYAVYGGLAAGIFEETGRFIFLRVVMKKGREPQDALMYGAGHGGIEAILIVGVTYVNNIIYSIMINTGIAKEILSALEGEVLDATAAAFTALSTAAPTMFLAAGVERICAIALHMALSVLVYTALRRRKFAFVLLSVVLHALVNAVSVLVNSAVSPWIAEACILVMVLLIWWYAAGLYRAAKREETPPTRECSED